MPEEAIGIPGAVESIRVRGALPRKRRVNLAYVTRTRVPWVRILLAVAVCVFACVWVVRHGILDRFAALRAAEQSLEDVRGQFQEAEDALVEYYESRDIYVHVTWSDMTEQEIKLLNPLDVAELLERMIMPISPMDGWSLSGSSLTLSVRTPTLEDANELAQRLREEPMIKYCAVLNGSRGAPDPDGSPSGFTSSIVIYFNDGDNSKIGAANK